MNELIGKIFTGVAVVVGVLALVAAIGLLLAFPIKWCWNYTMPYLFDLKTITWGQAWCIDFICHSLIKASQTNNNNKN